MKPLRREFLPFGTIASFNFTTIFSQPKRPCSALFPAKHEQRVRIKPLDRAGYDQPLCTNIKVTSRSCSKRPGPRFEGKTLCWKVKWRASEIMRYKAIKSRNTLNPDTFIYHVLDIVAMIGNSTHVTCKCIHEPRRNISATCML